MSILSTGEGYTPPSWTDTSLGRQPLSRDGHCSGRYASYWNAILLPPATKLGQSYVFTGICHSVNRGVHLVLGGVCSGWVVPGPRGVPSPGGCLLQVWGCVRYSPRDQVHPPDQAHPLGPGTPPGTRYTPPGPGTPPPRTRYTPQCTACREIRSMSGRYASCWNAILFCFCFYFCYEIKNLEAKSCAKRKTKRHVRCQCRATNKRCKSATLFVLQPHPNPEINRKLSQISCLCLHGFFYNKELLQVVFFPSELIALQIRLFDAFKTERCLTFFDALNDTIPDTMVH